MTTIARRSFRARVGQLPRLCLMLALGLVSACSSGAKSLDVPLVFRPEKVASGRYNAVPASPALKLHIAPVVDDRAAKDSIGQNAELRNSEPRPIRAADRTPAEFFDEVLAKELKLAGYPSTSSRGDANRVLVTRLTRFYTVESRTYNGEVAAAVEVRDASDRVIWQGQASGSSSRFGRSMSRENYQECFSDATLNLISGLLSNKDFQAAMTVN